MGSTILVSPCISFYADCIDIIMVKQFGKSVPNFMAKNQQFAELNAATDIGVGCSKKQAQPFTLEEEE